MRTHPVRSVLSAAAVLLAALGGPATSAAAQALHTVHADGSADFTTIQAAVDAAAPGDVVLVLGGLHENVVVDKGVALVATHGAIGKAFTPPGSLLPALTIAGVPAGQSVLVSGFTVFVGAGSAPAALSVHDVGGAVWVQDAFVDSYGAPAVVASDAASLAITDSLLQTNLVPAQPDGTPVPAAGLHVVGTSCVYGYEADMKGSHGTLVGAGNPTPTAAPDGGPGLLAQGGRVHLTGGTIVGGSGNSLQVGGCMHAGDGGDGVVTQDGDASGPTQVRLRGVSVQGGGVGFFQPSCAPTPTPGQAFDVLPGTLEVLAEAPRVLALPGHAPGGSNVTLHLAGEEGDLVFLLVAAKAAPAVTVGHLDLHLDLDTLLLMPAFPLPGGSLDVPLTLPVLPGGAQALVVPMQAVFVDAQGSKHAGPPRALVIH